LRGNNFLYGETEYRFPITREGGVLGVVLFLNATTTDNPVKSGKIIPFHKAGIWFWVQDNGRQAFAHKPCY